MSGWAKPHGSGTDDGDRQLPEFRSYPQQIINVGFPAVCEK
jgi:hypothetical protein